MQIQGDEMKDGDEVYSRLKIQPAGHENPSTASCRCTGPQDDQPMCPCRMKRHGVVKRDGRWVIPEQDLGEAWGR